MLAELRRWRRRELVRIAWRDLAGWADSRGDARGAVRVRGCGHRPRRWRMRGGRSLRRYGEPRSASGQLQPLVVIGMGKLGGGELNFSSDVDLVLLFPRARRDRRRARASPTRSSSRASARALIRLLETPTARWLRAARRHAAAAVRRQRAAGGELRLLRGLPAAPWARLGALRVREGARRSPRGALRRAIQAHAIRPFVYRRYLDYGVFESLREMKALIEREVERRELADHVKLGPGGIREIEFIVQAFQLIRGGRDRRLQTTSLLQALARFGESAAAAAEAVVRSCARRTCSCAGWRTACRCSRDAQVHRLPADALARERIALAMGAPDWAALMRRARPASRLRQPPLPPGRVWRRPTPSAGAVKHRSGTLLGQPGRRRPRSRRSLARAGFADSARSGAPAAGAARLGRWCAGSMSPGASACRRCCRRC